MSSPYSAPDKINQIDSRHLHKIKLRYFGVLFPRILAVTVILEQLRKGRNARTFNGGMVTDSG